MTVHIATPHRPQARQIRHANFRHCFEISAVALLLGSSLSSADDLLRWDVNNTTQSAGTTAVATAVVDGISGSTITSGSGTTAGNTSLTDTWNRTFTATSADFAAAQTAGNYFSFTTTVAPGFTVSFTGMTGMILSKTSNGPTSAGLFYSTDGGTTYTQTGTTSGTGTGSGTAAAFSSTMSTSPIVILGGVAGKTVNWRMVVYGGSAGSRLGIIRTDPFNIDVSLTGTSVPDVTPPNLVWTGSGGNDWNTTPGNTNWADTTQANAPTPFASNNNVTIDLPATIAVDSGGVTAGTLAVSNTTGEVSLTGGNITSLTLLKTGAGTLRLGGTNGIAAGITIAGGTLHAESNAALSKPVQINGGALKTDGTDVAIARLLGLGSAGSTIETVGSANYSGRMVAIGAAVDASNSLTKTGSGILTFSNTDTTEALGSQTTKGNSGKMIKVNIADGSVVFSGVGQRNLGGACTWDGPVTLAGGVLKLHGGSIAGTGNINVSVNSTISSRLDYGTATVSNAISVNSAITLSVTADNGANALALNSAISGDGTLNKGGNGIVRLGGINTYAGPTNVTAGTLRINGDNSAATGTISVVSGATLGGNGTSGGALVMQSGGRLGARITDWSGTAGVGYDDLSVASFNAASVPMTVTLDSAGLTNFSETSKSFAILNTSGGITNFSPANVTITAPGFGGTGTWSIAEAAGSLVLSYTAPVIANNYSTWATANGISGELASGDFDKDGLSNLVEYALGLNPTTSSVPPGGFNGSLLSFTKGTEAKANGDVTYEIEQSSDLSEWVVVVPHNAESLEISHTLPSGLTKEFARLKITQIP